MVNEDDLEASIKEMIPREGGGGGGYVYKSLPMMFLRHFILVERMF